MVKRRNSADPQESSVSDPQTIQRVVDSFAAGISLNALTALQWGALSPRTYFEPLCRAMQDTSAAMQSGNLTAAEAMLMAQATALNAIFADFMRRAHSADYLDQADKYTKLGLRAQSQCARTIEVLGNLKNPTVIAKQANVSTGPQQVINGAVNQVARVEMQILDQNKLMGEPDGELARVDPGATCTSTRRNPPLETVAIEHWPSHSGRQGSRRQKCE